MSNGRWTMPPEWSPHDGTWMAWPVSDYVLVGTGGADGAYRAWAGVANAIARFERLTMMVPPGQVETARGYLDDAIEIVEHPIGESWMRDFGPTFVVSSDGALGAVDWQFNGWGGRTFPEGAMDALVAREIARRSGAERIPSKLVNEGGGIHVDGEGTVLVTESVQLNPNRNPSWTREEVEAELHLRLGTRKAIWLPRGLVADTDETGTDGHIDTLACFAAPGVVLAHREPDPQHPDFATCDENIRILKAATDAEGRSLEVIELPAPSPKRDVNGNPLSLTYVNFSFVNGGIVMCAFEDPRDAEVAELFGRLFPDREIVPVTATRIFEGGGGVHCITQHQPRA
ncbi:agmatine deiminase family protein [Lutibaculum baratangense]|uniref:Agmatine deiminase n=1 Tax=Lutibaculum baratangense AMV1 TaxID=631454 RepID=V4TF39_9HYPH|nr:agmatine deiminase family protein [Lutibaculum baratangense]ESR24798.1 Agmatine deiminase [Lutibaculum baratangense AMV1]